MTEIIQGEFTAVIQKRGRWYIAWVEEVPGANTQGRTFAEVRRNLREVLREILELNRKLAQKKQRRSARRGSIAAL